jgi:hypothetical protein
MRLIGRHGVIDQPAPDQVESFAFPGLLLATILNQF